jgi:hypothetical protein
LFVEGPDLNPDDRLRGPPTRSGAELRMKAQASRRTSALAAARSCSQRFRRRPRPARASVSRVRRC